MKRILALLSVITCSLCIVAQQRPDSPKMLIGGKLPITAKQTLTPVHPSITLTWVAPTSPSPLLKYNIYRSTVSGTYTTTPLASIVPDSNGNLATTYTDLTVSAGLIEYYTVTAVNAYAESNKSNEASGAPPCLRGDPATYCSAPSTPTGAKATGN